MTVALAGRAPATFEIKSANLPLVSLLLKSADLRALAAELEARFGDIPDFFDNDPLVLDLSPLQGQSEEPIDFPTLLAMLRSYHVLPVAARGGTPGQMAAALRAGLAPAPEAAPQRIEKPLIPPDQGPGQAPQVRNDSPTGAGRPRDRSSARLGPRHRPTAAIGPAGLCARPRPGGTQNGQPRRRSHRRRPYPCLRPAAWQGHSRRPRQHRGADHFPVPGTRTHFHRRGVPHQRSTSCLPTSCPSPLRCGWSAAPRASW